MKSISKNDLLIINIQLGRSPDNVMGIIRKCPQNRPMVIITSPYCSQKGVFPTTYWLSCPYYVKEVARLEDKGLIKKFTRKLKRDPVFYEKLKKAHQEYAGQRFSLLTEQQIKEIKQKSLKMLRVLKKSGVGGIMTKKGIKCLHTHLADFLVNKTNPVGQKVLKRLPPITECDCFDCGL